MGQSIYGKATYDLYELQDLLKDPATRRITYTSEVNASSVGIVGKEEIVKRILQLRPNEIYKTMESDRFPGTWQDVYHSPEGRITLYIKLQKSVDGKNCVVIQLKQSTSHGI